MIRGLKELLEKHNAKALSPEEFEEELNKILPESHMPKSVYNELNEKYKLLDKQKHDTDALLEEANKSLKDSADFKAKYEGLLNQQKADNEKYAKDIADLKKGYAIETALSKAGARNMKAVKALLDDSKIIMGDDGNVIGIEEQLAEIRKDNDFLFATSQSKGGKPSFGNGGSGNGNPADDALASRIAEAMGVHN